MDKAMFNRKLGEFVKFKRQQKKLSQANLSDKMGLDYQYISRVERGLVSPTLFWIKRLCESLDTELALFIKELESYSGTPKDSEDSE